MRLIVDSGSTKTDWICINDKGELKIAHFLKSLILKPERIFELISVNFKFSKSKKVLESLVNSF